MLLGALLVHMEDLTAAHQCFNDTLTACTSDFVFVSLLLHKAVLLRQYFLLQHFFFVSTALAHKWGSRKKAEQEYCRGKREKWCREDIFDGLPRKDLLCTLIQAPYSRKGVKHC